MVEKPENNEEFTESAETVEENRTQTEFDAAESDAKPSILSRLINHSKILPIGAYVIAFVVVVLAVWGIGSLIVHDRMPPSDPTPTAAFQIEPLPNHIPTPSFSTENRGSGIFRQVEIAFAAASKVEERTEVITYTVKQGDTIFGIADKFGLKPETVLWSNRYIIGDTPDGLVIGVELFILPEDGLYHKWSEGEGLNGVSEFYGVKPADIINHPLNGLDPNTIGDYANPNIEPGTLLVVPGGIRPTVAWIVARDAPASGNSYLGPGACGGIIFGNVGTGTFTWPTAATWLSGYDYTPPVHNGLDFDGDFGSPIYAADTGVIVYSGWSDRGYGNLIVVDHDDGWQTFYAHMLDGTLLPCGTNVQKGQLIASMGSTGNSSGPHLHFELRLNGHPMNPWLFLN